MLYHLSERGDIALFEPRPATSAGAALEGEAVWAIDDRLLHNYLLPRDCPRVTFYAGPDSRPDDVKRLMGTSTARFVVAIESAWLSAVRAAQLYRYEMPPKTFVVHNLYGIWGG